MSYKKLKDIYMAKNLQELNKQVDIKQTYCNPQALAKSFKKIIESANAAFLEGDEEKAFVLFMRLLNIHTVIKKSTEYKKDKKYYDALCTPVDVTKSLEKAEKLAVNLKNRYDEKDAKEIVKKLDLNEVVESTVANDKQQVISMEQEPKNDEKIPLPVTEFISPTELYSLISESKNYLIMDIRMDFESSQILAKNCISIPENIIPAGCTSYKIESYLSPQALPLWKMRHNMEPLILVDWDTSSINIQPSLPICHLRNALFKFSMAPSKNQPIILNGGYEQWLFFYPTLSTNSSAKKITKQNTTFLPSLDQIQYNSAIFDRPSEKLNQDIPQVDIKNIIREQMLPTIDRRNKPKKMEQAVEDLNGVHISKKQIKIDKNSQKANGPKLNYVEENTHSASIPTIDRSAKPKLSDQKSDTSEADLIREETIKDLQRLEQMKNLEIQSLTEVMREKRKIEMELLEIKTKNAQLIEKSIQENNININLEDNASKNNNPLTKDIIEKVRINHPVTDKLREIKSNALETNQNKSINIKDHQSNDVASNKSQIQISELLTKDTQNSNKKPLENLENLSNISNIENNSENNAIKIKSSSIPNNTSSINNPYILSGNKSEINLNPYINKEDVKILPTIKNQQNSFKSELKENHNINKNNKDTIKEITYLKDESEFSGNLKRSHSFPNIAKLMDDAHIPPTNRALKPASQSLKLSTEISNAKVRQLNPVWGTSHEGLTGLRNLGNTCYMNSIIQCLSNAVPLSVYFLTNSYLQDLSKENKSSHILTNEFVTVVKALWSAQYKVISPIDFRMSICKMDSMFATSEHQDSQELLQYLLTGLHEALNKGVKKSPQHEQNNDNMDDEVAADQSWLLCKHIDDSIIVELFTGQYKSVVMCSICRKNSMMFETFTCLTLQIPSHTQCDLAQCLLQFSKKKKVPTATLR